MDEQNEKYLEPELLESVDNDLLKDNLSANGTVSNTIANTRTKTFLIVCISLFLFILLAAALYFGTSFLFNKEKKVDIVQEPKTGSYENINDINNRSRNLSDEDIANIVSRIKSQTTLPSQLNEFMTAVDFTAEPNAVRFHIVVTGMEKSLPGLQEAIKKETLPGICSNDDMIDMLNSINFETLFTFKETGESILIVITKRDCDNFLEGNLE